MRTTRHQTSKACAFFLALLAVTLNFLQPLAHAASMRNGAPGMAGPVLCRAANADLERSRSISGSTAPERAADVHDCCLGLAHAAPLVAPAGDFSTLTLIEGIALSVPTADQSASIGIRDGPPQPRGPPTPR